MANDFSKRWKAVAACRGGAVPAEYRRFWVEFFHLFDIDSKRVYRFEEYATELNAAQGGVDLFWKGTLLVGHRSRGKSLDKAYMHVLDCFPGMKERDLPKYVLVSDLTRFRLYHLQGGTYHEFALDELSSNIKRFAFIVGYCTQVVTSPNSDSLRAVECMGKLHDALKASHYTGHSFEMLLFRLLFCLFADNTGIFQPAGAFRFWIEERTAENGSDLGSKLGSLFRMLNTPERERSRCPDEQFAVFPFVDIGLFEEVLPIANFDATMREDLLDCCAVGWGAVSPAVFGAVFQSIVDAKARRSLGMHYTGEENILKVVKPLFLDELRAEFDRVRSNMGRLSEFHKKLCTLNFLDPACGCGNFLVIAYRELRMLELDVLRAVHEAGGMRFLDMHSEISVDVGQFYGIEIEEFSVQIAQATLWLVDTQMNMLVSGELGICFARIPLKTSQNIVHGNALTLDWNDVLPANRASYVFGNPPYVGKQLQSSRQKAEMAQVFRGVHRAGVLDYVAAWFVKATRYMTNVAATELLSRVTSMAQGNHRYNGIRCAFVCTNSVTQGEQVGVLWGWLLAHGIQIHFAHRTFQWSSEAPGEAAVHCVIVGFGLQSVLEKTIFEYEDIRGEPHAILAGNISPYLLDAPDVVLIHRRRPLCLTGKMVYGSKPADGGYLLLSDEEKASLLAVEPGARKWLRRFLGADEYINGVSRWCLWLVGIALSELRSMPEIFQRTEVIRAVRLASRKVRTQRSAATPFLFQEIRQPSSTYLLVPSVSSERREFIPIGFFPPDVIASNAVLMIPDATSYHFAILSSTMHNAWVRAVCGCLESRFRYSATIVYNNYPWPDPTDRERADIEATGRGILDARALQPDSSLADLYDRHTMPFELRKAHAENDCAVEAAYRYEGDNSDSARVAFLFDLYSKLSCLPPPDIQKHGRNKSQISDK